MALWASQFTAVLAYYRQFRQTSKKNPRKVPSKSANFATFLIFLCVTLFISVCDIAMTNNIGKVDWVFFSVPNSINQFDVYVTILQKRNNIENVKCANFRKIQKRQELKTLFSSKNFAVWRMLSKVSASSPKTPWQVYGWQWRRKVTFSRCKSCILVSGIGLLRPIRMRMDRCIAAVLPALMLEEENSAPPKRLTLNNLSN